MIKTDLGLNILYDLYFSTWKQINTYTIGLILNYGISMERFLHGMLGFEKLLLGLMKRNGYEFHLYRHTTNGYGTLTALKQLPAFGNVVIANEYSVRNILSGATYATVWYIEERAQGPQRMSDAEWKQSFLRPDWDYAFADIGVPVKINRN